MSKIPRLILQVLAGGCLFAAGWWMSGQRQPLPPTPAPAAVASPVPAPAAAPQELEGKHSAVLTKRRLNIASLAALFDVDQTVADALLGEYEGVRDQYRLLTRDALPENDPLDLSAFFIQHQTGARQTLAPVPPAT